MANSGYWNKLWLLFHALVCCISDALATATIDLKYDGNPVSDNTADFTSALNIKGTWADTEVAILNQLGNSISPDSHNIQYSTVSQESGPHDRSTNFQGQGTIYASATQKGMATIDFKVDGNPVRDNTAGFTSALNIQGTWADTKAAILNQLGNSISPDSHNIRYSTVSPGGDPHDRSTNLQDKGIIYVNATQKKAETRLVKESMKKIGRPCFEQALLQTRAKRVCFNGCGLGNEEAEIRTERAAIDLKLDGNPVSDDAAGFTPALNIQGTWADTKAAILNQLGNSVSPDSHNIQYSTVGQGGDPHDGSTNLLDKGTIYVSAAQKKVNLSYNNPQGVSGSNTVAMEPTQVQCLDVMTALNAKYPAHIAYSIKCQTGASVIDGKTCLGSDGPLKSGNWTSGDEVEVVWKVGYPVCDDGGIPIPVDPNICPEEPENLKNCESARVGDLCEGDGDCGTTNSLNSCGGWDVYRKVSHSADGVPLIPECPADDNLADLAACSAVDVGDLCEDNSTTNSFDKCGDRHFYRKTRVLRCPDGSHLTPAVATQCPGDANLVNCNDNSVDFGDFCEGDGECGTTDSLDNCGAYDVYQKVFMVIRYVKPDGVETPVDHDLSKNKCSEIWALLESLHVGSKIDTLQGKSEAGGVRTCLSAQDEKVIQTTLTDEDLVVVTWKTGTLRWRASESKFTKGTVNEFSEAFQNKPYSEGYTWYYEQDGNVAELTQQTQITAIQELLKDGTDVVVFYSKAKKGQRYYVVGAKKNKAPSGMGNTHSVGHFVKDRLILGQSEDTQIALQLQQGNDVISVYTEDAPSWQIWNYYENQWNSPRYWVDVKQKDVETFALPFLEKVLAQTKIRHINFNDCVLKADGSRVLAEASKVNANIEWLSLVANEIGDGAVDFAEALKGNSHIEGLYIRDNQITDVGAKALATALDKNKVLKFLDLRVNQITSVGAKAFAKTLEANKIQRDYLGLSVNQIGDDGAKALAKALKANELRKLGLGNNQIGDDGAVAIAQAIEANTGLVTIWIYGNKFGAVGKRALSAAKESRRKQNLPIEIIWK